MTRIDQGIPDYRHSPITYCGGVDQLPEVLKAVGTSAIPLLSHCGVFFCEIRYVVVAINDTGVAVSAKPWKRKAVAISSVTGDSLQIFRGDSHIQRLPQVRGSRPAYSRVRRPISIQNTSISFPVAQGRFAEAGRLHSRALSIREEVLGPDHPEVAESLSNLAGVFQNQVTRSLLSRLSTQFVVTSPIPENMCTSRTTPPRNSGLR